LIKTIFIFFRARHVLLDDELDAIDEVILQNPTSTNEEAEFKEEEESTPDLILEINTMTKRNRKSGSSGSSRKSSRDSSSSIKTPQSSKSTDSNRSVFDFDDSRPSYCVNPMDVVCDSDSGQVEFESKKKEKSLIPRPKEKNVHFLTTSYRTNPLDDVEDKDWDSSNTGSNPMDQIFTQSPPLSRRPNQGKSPSPTQQQQPLGNPYLNPMDAAITDPINQAAATSSSSSWNSNYNNNKKKKKKKKSAGEQINPDLLSRITSED
jgi:hypothetical protein